MVVAHCSDLHISRGPRLADQTATLAAMVQSMLDQKPDLVLIVGDLFGREVPHLSWPEERMVLFDAVTKLAEHSPVYIVAGNHDEARDLAGLRFLQTRWSITVCDRATACDRGEQRIVTPAGIANVYGLPYPSSKWLLAADKAPRTIAETRAAANEAMSGLLAAWAFTIRRARRASPNEPHILAAHVAVCGAQTAGGEVLDGHEIEVSRTALDSLPADYIALGHIHKRQEVAERAWYCGSSWRTDHSESDDKGWHLVHITPQHRDLVMPLEMRVPNPAPPYTHAEYPETMARQACLVEWMPNPCRPFRTLVYRWAAPDDASKARWLTRPTDAEIAACAGAEVRARLTVPEQHCAGCPWDDELARIGKLAVRVQVERVIEPQLRVRAPAVAMATDPAAKMRAYWRSLATPPTEAEQTAALACLARVQHA